MDGWGGRLEERDSSSAVRAYLIVLEWSGGNRAVGYSGGGCGFHLVVVGVPWVGVRVTAVGWVVERV